MLTVCLVLKTTVAALGTPLKKLGVPLKLDCDVMLAA